MSASLRRSFAGWIPTITGQLSFSLVALKSPTLDCVTANQERIIGAVPPSRTIVSIVRRVARDVPLPWRLFQRARIKHCVLVATTDSTKRPAIEGGNVVVHSDELGRLVGKVCVIPFHKRADTKSRAEVKVASIRTLIGKFKRGDGVDDLKVAVEEQLNRQDGVKIISAEFEIFRTGEIRIHCAPEVPSEFCEQVYYLVKDLSHRHYHHAHSDDNLLPLTPATSADDVSWRRNTLWCLTRMVLEARRRDRLDGYKSALGMLAYAEAFQGVLGRIHRIGKDKFGIVKDTAIYDFAHTRASLEAKIAEREYKNNAKMQAVAISISTILATIALWISSVQISQSICDSIKNSDKVCSIRMPHFTAHAVKLLIERPFEVFGLLLLLGLILLGKRLLAFIPIASVEYAVMAWSQAFGATASRAAGVNDRFGRLVSQISVSVFGGILITIVGLLTRVFWIPEIVAKICSIVWRNILTILSLFS